MKKTKKPVEPEDLSPRQLAVVEIERCTTPEIAPWLTDAILALGKCSERPVSDEALLLDHLDYIRRAVIIEAFKKHPQDHDAALLKVLLRAPSFWITITGTPARINEAEVYVPRMDVGLYERLLRMLLPSWREQWRAESWSDVLLRVWTDEPGVTQVPEYNDTALDLLLEEGLVEPAAMIDMTGLRDFDRFHSSWTPPGVPRQLEFWIHRLGARALWHALRVLMAAPAADRAAVALGIHGVARFQVGIEGHQLDPDERGVYADALCAQAEFLGDRLHEHAHEITYLGAYWWSVLNVSVVDHSKLGPKERARAAASAKEALGRLRDAARAASSDPDKGPNRDTEFYPHAVFVLARCGGVWHAMKALLLLLRALTVAAVAPDLRARHEDGLEPPPPRWSWVPEYLLNLVHVQARWEQRTDPALQELRTELARFCLDRLRMREREEATASAKTNDEMVEPDPNWRMCYIRAVRELRANPDNRGHHVLHRSFQNDPDEDVRRAAKVAYGEMAKGSRLPEDMSPRRLIFAALWWLRQAHLMALDMPVDAQGARRTRQREVRETARDTTDKP